MNDKDLEMFRYDRRAKKLLASADLTPSTNIPLYMLPPINSYQRLLKQIPKGCKVLEIGAGMGENTEFLLGLGLEVCATDISPKSVEILTHRFSNHASFKAEIADMEQLPFSDGSFGAVCSAGSLSYGDNVIVMNEIYRVLDNGGAFIALDSLNNSPIYKLNRYVHFVLGNRSKSTLVRMPTVDMIHCYSLKFGKVDVAYFGSITWLFPVLSKFLNDKTTSNISNVFDKIISVKKSAFKFTIKAIKS
jgi:ubiquinone/menaquinone biosynthesis C-methylase UbiE